MDSIVRDVDSLFDAEGNHAVGKAEGEPRRRTGLGGPSDDGSGLVLGDTEVAIRARSQPPRALTQYVIVSGANARAPTFASEATADKNSIFLPSTTGLRNTAHKEAFRNTPSSSKQDSSYSRRESLTSVRANHSPMPSSGSGSFRVPPPPTHPEALPLSAQELLERRKEEARVAESSSASTREGLYEYLRGLHTHSATPSIASASSTVSKRSRSDVPSRPVLSPQQPRIPRSKDKPPSQTPSSPTRTSTPQSALMDNDNERHARSRSNTSASTLSSSVSPPHKYSLNSSTQLPLSFPTSIFRRSPSLRSPTPLSPTDSNTSFNSEAPFDWYSPSLAAIPDQHEDGEVGLDRQGTILASSAPLEGHLGHIVSRGRSPTAIGSRCFLASGVGGSYDWPGPELPSG
ncbi:hypothetical protein FRC17_008927 [Serendipita sp. 399]|nr:hypothetical protein FRC17_008927 [Serendipita sp. 399]